jgi:purine-cytosine permease-like protein
MSDDDEAPEKTESESTGEPSGIRRSTFTPPTAGPDGELPLDDDALADALAADFGRLMTGTMPIVSSTSYPDLTSALAEESVVPVSVEPLSVEPVSVEPVSVEPVSVEPVSVEPVSVEDTMSTDEPSPLAAPWMSFPPPDPAQAVDLGEVPSDADTPADIQFDALVSGASDSPPSTLDRIEQLEAELRKRGDSSELGDWDKRMRTLGDASDPFAAPPPPAPSTDPFTIAEAPVAEWPMPRAEDAAPAESAPPAPELAAPASPPPPVWEVPAPSPTWAPGPEYGSEPEFELPPAEPKPPPPLVTEVPDFSRLSRPPAPSWEPRAWEPHLPEQVQSGQFADDASSTPAADWASVEDTIVPGDAPTVVPPPHATEIPVFVPGPGGLPPIDLPEIVFPEEVFGEPATAEPSEPHAPERSGSDDAEPGLTAGLAAGAAAGAAGATAASAAEIPPVIDPPVRLSRRAQRLPWFAREAESGEDAAQSTVPPGEVQAPDESGPELLDESAASGDPNTQADPFPWALTPSATDSAEPEPSGVVDALEAEQPVVPIEPAQPAEPSSSTPPFGVLPFGVRPLDDYTPPAPWDAVTEASIEPDAAAPAGAAAPEELVVDAVPATESQAEAEAEPEPEPVTETEAEPEPLPNSGDAMFSPPPLVEPERWSGSPLIPADVGSDGFGTAPPFAEDPALPDVADATLTTPETLFIEPLPVAAGEPVPSDTGSITVIDQAYEEELADDVDETDRVFAGIPGPVVVSAAGVAAVPRPVAAPSGPIATTRVPTGETVLFSDEPQRYRVFSIEASGPEPTPIDYRAGRAARLFWLWFAANSSVLSVGLGAVVFAVGMSLRQSIVSVLAGVALSFIPLGLTTLASKRSGQPTMIVSRATFGMIGNVVPAVLALVTRVFWGAVLLWLLGSSIAIILVGGGVTGGLGETPLLLISLAVGFVLAVLVAFAGYPLLARIQLVLSILSGVLVVGLIAITARYVDLSAALTVGDGPWLLTITGTVLVFSFVGLAWAQSGGDLARYQRPRSSGASSMLWATFGSTLPSFLLVAYGALLAASDDALAQGLLVAPLDTLAALLPAWYPVPLLAATALSLLSGIILTLYSSGFALQAIGVRLGRQWSIVVVAVLLGALALLIALGGVSGLDELLRDLATTLAVPTAAWAGIFAAETMIRNRRFESGSLVSRGGVYGDVRWVNLVGLVLITAVGFSLTTATVGWLSWQGFGFVAIGIPVSDPLAATDVGVLVALVLGLLLPIVAGIPAIRKQEATEV